MHFKDIVEKSKKDIIYTEEFYKIKNLYEERIDNGYDYQFDWDDGIKDKIEKIFIDYPNKSRFINLYELENYLLTNIGIMPEFLVMPVGSDLFNVNQEQLMVYVEYVYNMVYFLRNYTGEHESKLNMNGIEIARLYAKITFLLGYIETLLNDMSVEIIQQNNSYFFVNAEKKKDVDKALMVNNEFVNAEYLYEYIHIQNKNDLEKKREILKLLANDYEKYESKIDIINRRLSSNIRYILNNYEVRHENIEVDSKNHKKFLESVGKEKFIEVYDKLFDMLVCAITLVDIEEYNKYVDNLKKDDISK